VLEGEIVGQNDSSVTVKTLTLTMSIPRSRITAIHESAPGTVQLNQALELMKKGELKEALIFVEQARQAGAEEEAIKEVTQKIAEQSMAVELASYKETFRQARIMFRAGQDSQAMMLVEGLLSKKPENTFAQEFIKEELCKYYLESAELYRDRVAYDKAIWVLNKVIEINPDIPHIYIELGDIYQKSSSTWKRAAKNYLQALKLGANSLSDEEKVSLHWNLGELFRQAQDWQDASRHFHAAYCIDPDSNTRLVENLIQSFIKYVNEIWETAPKKGLKVAEAGLRIQYNADLQVSKGFILSELEQYEESNTALIKVAVDNPRRGLYLKMAENHFAMGEIILGREKLKREIKAHPDHYAALCLLGDYALLRDDFTVAENYFTKARELDPDTPRASLGLGKSYRQNGKLNKAKEMVQEVLDRLPEDREANLEMGRIYLDEEELNKAKDYFADVVEEIEISMEESDDEPSHELRALHADALIARGEINLLTAGPGTANVDFQKALGVWPDYPMAYFAIGKAYRKKYSESKSLDDLKTAEENLILARQLAPENPQIPLELGILYTQELAKEDSDNKDKYNKFATENWETYIRLGGANTRQVRQWIDEVKD
jgi:tetratricopeptide (TPR) repeat protein